MALAWGGSTDSTTTGYVVYAFEENTTLLARVDVGGSTYVEIDGLKEGLSYTFYVTAYNPYYVESPPSLAVNFQVPGLVLMVSGAGIGPCRVCFPAAPGCSHGLQAPTGLVNWSTIWQTGVVNKYGRLECQDPRARYYLSRF